MSFLPFFPVRLQIICRTMSRHRAFRSDYRKCSIGKRSADRALDKRITVLWVSKEAQEEVHLLIGRAARVKNSEKGSMKLRKAR